MCQLAVGIAVSILGKMSIGNISVSMHIEKIYIFDNSTLKYPLQINPKPETIVSIYIYVVQTKREMVLLFQ